MKKRINKHLEKRDKVKVYIVDENGNEITDFEGFIIEESEKYILMSDMFDFYYNGLVVLRKRDIYEIRCSDNEKFFKYMLDKEKITDAIFEKRNQIDFKLGSFKEMFESLQRLGIPIIIECDYGTKDRFIIGPVSDFDNKKVKINYFNSRGVYDLKPVVAKYKDITFIKIDSPYANIFFKYAKEIE